MTDAATVALRVEGYPGGVAHVPAALLGQLVGPRPPEDHVSNGCGPKLGGTIAGRLLTRIIPDRPHGFPIVAGCAWHDFAYSLGGDRKARRRADFDFACNVVACVRSVDGSLSALRVFSIALCYWWAVRAGGWAAWNYRKRLAAETVEGARVLRQMRPRPRGPVKAALHLPVAATRLAWRVVRAR